MNGIYLSIVLLALYGDILKRYIPPETALFMLYSISIVILLLIYRIRNEKASVIPISREGVKILFFVKILISIYLLQLFTSINAPFMEGLSHALYMCIPLLYVVVIQEYCPEFELSRLGNYFLWLMIPVNLVGLAQYFIDPQFFASSTYNADSGIIYRNLLEGSFFARFPSVFASADRYSSMGLMQVYFVFILLLSRFENSFRNFLWISFNFVSAFAALFIAGARSRILIIVSVFAIMSIVVLLSCISATIKHTINIKLVKFVSFALILVVGFYFFGKTFIPREETEVFPVLTFLVQTYESNDVQDRIEQAIDLSLIPENITLFGEGLGSIDNAGKPGEFGIYSIWIESGLVWGSFLLIAFIGFIYVLSILTVRAFIAMKPVHLFIYCTALLLLIFGLLAGFTGVFELSTGILLCCSIAVITRSPYYITGHSFTAQPTMSDQR
ncbi:MAG TPA: hypothetical protein VL122_01405 [Nitrospirota bacterium]|nr:hypothetical protein [Nitrospirota bacterium]